jgi:aldehyde:ferredoxin oxidoreductase
MDTLNGTKIALVANLMELWSGYDSIGLCVFATPPARGLAENSAAELVSAVTGWDVRPSEIRAWGRRRLTFMRAYNVREGLTSAADVLSRPVFHPPRRCQLRVPFSALGVLTRASREGGAGGRRRRTWGGRERRP